MESSNEVSFVGNAVRVHGANSKSSSGSELAPLRSPPMSALSQGFGGNGTFEREGSFPSSQPESSRIQFRACQGFVEYHMSQYLLYIGKVRRLGFEPKNLLVDLGVADSGPNAPPQDFWYLIAVRDRFINEAKKLIELCRSRQQEELRTLRRSGPLAFVMFAILQLIPIRRIGLLVIPILTYACHNSYKATSMWRYRLRLETMVELATKWELEEKHRRDVEGIHW